MQLHLFCRIRRHGLCRASVLWPCSTGFRFSLNHRFLSGPTFAPRASIETRPTKLDQTPAHIRKHATSASNAASLPKSAEASQTAQSISNSYAGSKVANNGWNHKNHADSEPPSFGRRLTTCWNEYNEFKHDKADSTTPIWMDQSQALLQTRQSLPPVGNVLTPSIVESASVPIRRVGALQPWKRTEFSSESEKTASKRNADQRARYLSREDQQLTALLKRRSTYFSVHREPSLRQIFLRYLVAHKYKQSSPASENRLEEIRRQNARDFTLDENLVRTLQKYRYTPNDLVLWATIFNASNGDEATKVLLESRRPVPHFIFTQLLSHPNFSTATYRQLLHHAWKLIIESSKARSSLANKDFADADEIVLRHRILEPNAFEFIFYKLLALARTFWPKSMIEISRMMPVYSLQLIDQSGDGPFEITRDAQRLLVPMLNKAIQRLAVPPASSPAASSEIRWHSQQMLLQSTTLFRPPLEISEGTYRALAVVAVVLPKNEDEKKLAARVVRSWPPWRDVKDGMDETRDPNGDLSRVVKIISKMKEAGYAPTSAEEILGILGGREKDGTPTIQTRAPTSLRKLSELVKHGDNARPEVIAARITATRDIFEAWAAFQSLGQSVPSQAMFCAMFEKLHAHESAPNLLRERHPTVGDGKEVIPLGYDNRTESERFRATPPSLLELYEQMRRRGIKPSGKTLAFLVSHARTLSLGKKFLLHSDVDRGSLDVLFGREAVHGRHPILRAIPPQIFAAYIQLLCRLSAYKSHLLLHAVDLARAYHSHHRPIWHAIFKAIARIYNPKRHYLLHIEQNTGPRRPRAHPMDAWTMFQFVVKYSQEAYAEMDPDSFYLACLAAENVISTVQLSSEGKALVVEALNKVNGVFDMLVQERKTIDEIDKGYQMFKPAFFHEISGVHLHAYVRVLGIAGESGRLLFVLKWIVQNQQEIQIFMTQRQRALLKRAMIASRVYLEEMDEHDALRQMKEITLEFDDPDGWGSWPTDEDVRIYRENDPRRKQRQAVEFESFWRNESYEKDVSQ